MCIVEAPIKANFDVVVKGGCVNVGSFENDYLRIRSDSGNVVVDRFLSDDFNVATVTGDVICKKNTQAMNIQLSTKSGNIKTDKLQGRNLKIFTDTGTVTTQASYCDESLFLSKNGGSLCLHNVHKNCQIVVENGGHVNLVVFDGKLELILKNGSANVLLSRILDNSSISIQNGELNLKIVETCFDITSFNVEAKEVHCNEIDSFRDGRANAKLKEENVVNVICRDGCVNIENTTVLELFQLLK